MAEQETVSGGGRRRKVLILAYYFPPMALSGVQRVLKLAKYLPDAGWDVTVLTVHPGAYFAFDDDLLDELGPEVEVVRTTSLDPTRGGRKTVGLPSESIRKGWARLSQFFLQPDNKVGWIPFAVKRGGQLLKEGGFDLIFSTAPPYSSHLAASRLARRSSLPLVLDFRDDWVGNPRHSYPTRLHRAASARWERQAIDAAAAVFVINDTILRSLAQRTGQGEKMILVPQGFDPVDFEHLGEESTEMNPDARPFVITYAGVFYDAQRPDSFLGALCQVLDRRSDVRVEARLVGLVPPGTDLLIEKLGLEDVVRTTGYVSHHVSCRELLSADALWMTVGKRPGASGISTGKLYEYAGTRKPILGLVPEGEARKFLEAYQASFIAEPDDIDAIATQLERMIDLWRHQRLPQPSQMFVSSFDRRGLAHEIAKIFDNLLESSCN